MAVVAAIRPKPDGVSSNSRASCALFQILGVLLRPHRHMAGLTVELDARVAAASLGAVVGDEEGRLDRLDQQVEGDLLLLRQAPQGDSCRCPRLRLLFLLLSFLSLRLNSISTRALAISAKASPRVVGLRPFTPGTSRSSPSSSTAENAGDQLAAILQLELCTSRPMART